MTLNAYVTIICASQTIYDRNVCFVKACQSNVKLFWLVRCLDACVSRLEHFRYVSVSSRLDRIQNILACLMSRYLCLGLSQKKMSRLHHWTGASPGLKMWGGQQAEHLQGVWRWSPSGFKVHTINLTDPLPPPPEKKLAGSATIPETPTISWRHSCGQLVTSFSRVKGKS